MAKAAAAKRKAKAKPKPKPKPKLSNKEQSERFIEVARRLGIEETGELFEKSFNKAVFGKNKVKSHT